MFSGRGLCGSRVRRQEGFGWRRKARGLAVGHARALGQGIGIQVGAGGDRAGGSSRNHILQPEEGRSYREREEEAFSNSERPEEGRRPRHRPEEGRWERERPGEGWRERERPQVDRWLVASGFPPGGCEGVADVAQDDGVGAGVGQLDSLAHI
jgi:hypothetical protein